LIVYLLSSAITFREQISEVDRSGGGIVQKKSDENKKILVRVDPEIMDMIPEFLENRNRDVKIITRKLLNRDFETIQSIAHRMKGSGEMYGFSYVTEKGSVIENAAKEKKISQIEHEVNDLDQYLKKVKVVE